VPLWDTFANAMRMSRRHRIRRDDAERLLAGGHDPERPDLSRLLAAASAPPQPHERAGLDAALAAFDEAGRAERPATSTPRRRRVLRPVAAAAAVSVLLVGGVAVAAETGYLPGADTPPARESPTPGEVPSSAPRTSPGGTSGPTGGPGHTASPRATTPAMAKLCRAWERRHEKGRSMKPEELRELARAAGGEARIPAFCAPPPPQPRGERTATPGPPTARPSASHPAPPNPSDHPGKGEKGDGGPAE
jgi:hypothetical protein